MSQLALQARQSAQYIVSRIGSSYVQPKAIIICGSGLGTLAASLVTATEIPYADIPHFQVSTVAGHASKLVYGQLQGVPVLAMVGRFHLYEGYHIKQTVYPIRVFKCLGIEVLIATNAAGGLNPTYKGKQNGVGDLVVLADHINMPGLAGQSPLSGPNEDEFGSRFTPLSDAYDLSLRQSMFDISERLQLSRTIHEGVYCFVAGPTYETRAECRMLRNMGADVVGMSTVPEVLVARHSGIRTMAISLVTNKSVLSPVPTGQSHENTKEHMRSGIANHEEVVDEGKLAASDMQRLISELVKQL